MGYYLHLVVRIYLVYLFVIISECGDFCPDNCVCKHGPSVESFVWVKARCGDTTPLRFFNELDFSKIYAELVQLNLTQNRLESFISKWQFPALQKLDLSENRLTELTSNQFTQFPNLRRLDISKNNIKCINQSAFLDLNYLERLKLDHNLISSIEIGTFKALTSLKQLDISNNPLTCDCELLWLLDWSKELSVKLSSSPKCESPSDFKGLLLRKLKIGKNFECKSPVGKPLTPTLTIIPEQKQVVFEGDSLRLICEARSIVVESFEMSDVRAISQIEWLWFESDPKEYFDDVEIIVRYVTETSSIVASLLVPSLSVNHSGYWSCKLGFENNNFSRGISVVVLSERTRYCPAFTTSDNKGTYTWPTTIVNHVVFSKCESIRPNHDATKKEVSIFCSPSGTWVDLNTSACAYVSESTRILEQFSKVNLNLTESTLFESLRHFKNYTSNLDNFRDVTDLVFALETIENYFQQLTNKKELSAILLEVITRLLELPFSYLNRVNSVQHDVFQRFINLMENIAEYAADLKLRKSNVVLREVPFTTIFPGTTCTWYDSLVDDLDRSIYCVPTDKFVLPDAEDRTIKALIQIPARLMYKFKNQDDAILEKSVDNKLLIMMYIDGKLFPIKNENHNWLVESPIIGAKIANMSVTDEVYPINIVLRVPDEGFPSDYFPAWWNSSADDYRGNWSTEACRLNSEIRDNAVFHCNRLGYYGLIQRFDNPHRKFWSGSFRLAHPAMYVGTLFLFISLFIAILSYCLCYVSIQMPKKAKHSLINMWIAVDLLLFVYTFGIYQTEDAYLCQIIGLSLHYLTLCSLLWMCVGVTAIYKRLNKSDRIELRDDRLPSEMPMKKPILGLYLIGWGISSIVCGISGAVNMKEYSVRERCFLSWTPTLSALFLPATILLLILTILFLMIRCTIYNLDASGHLSEGTQVTENVDLEMLEPNLPTRGSMQSLSSIKTSSSEAEDAEHAPLMQLKAYVIFLVIYVTTWLSCGFATVKPFKFRYEEDIFAIFYAICSVALGSFTIFFYCVARNDVRTRWFMVHSLLEKKGVWFRSRNVSDTNRNIPRLQLGPTPQIVAPSRCSSRSSSRTKSNSDNSKTANNLTESAIDEMHGAKINDINLVVLHRRQYRNNVATNLIENPANTAQMFYNPYQSTVARRFFRKQKRHNNKCNNLPVRKYARSDVTSIVSTAKPTSDDSQIDHRNIFTTNSKKVNNKNIHVEKVRHNKNRNVNVFSDSREELNLNQLPVDKLMMNAERLRRREINRPRIRKKHNSPYEAAADFNVKQDNIVEETNMRTVSQQCSLDYSSDSFSNRSRDEKLSHSEIMPPKRKCKKGKYSKSNNHNSYESELNEAVPKIYVNRSYDLLFSNRVQKRTSSVSTSELDEIYQQIRRGGGATDTKTQKVNNFDVVTSFSSRLSDPEINLMARDLTYEGHAGTENLSDDLETVV